VNKWRAVLDGQEKSKRISTRTRILVLCGGTGCGKTVAAASCIADEGGLAVSAGKLCELRRSRSWDDMAAWERLETARFILIDDVGATSDKDLPSVLHEIIDKRQRVYRTIITSNMTADDFRAFVDPRTASRLRESGVIVECSGGDLRGER